MLKPAYFFCPTSAPPRVPVSSSRRDRRRRLGAAFWNGVSISLCPRWCFRVLGCVRIFPRSPREKVRLGPREGMGPCLVVRKAEEEEWRRRMEEGRREEERRRAEAASNREARRRMTEKLLILPKPEERKASRLTGHIAEGWLGEDRSSEERQNGGAVHTLDVPRRSDLSSSVHGNGAFPRRSTGNRPFTSSVSRRMG